MVNLTSAAKKVNELAVSFKMNQGLLYAMAFDPKKKKILDNIGKFSNNINEITEIIANGECTFGALIADPPLYETLKKLLGVAERSIILRSFIRKSIEK